MRCVADVRPCPALRARCTRRLVTWGVRSCEAPRLARVVIIDGRGVIAVASEIVRRADNLRRFLAFRAGFPRKNLQNLGAPVGVQVPPFALTEFAYYRADEPYLTVDKCAERCRLLSALLTAAARNTTITKS
jgi:hypothetical protein